jgi:hypothetical protein
MITFATYSAILTGTAFPMACSMDETAPTNSNDSGKEHISRLCPYDSYA